MMYGFGRSGGTPGGRLGGALPEVVATALRVEAVTVELLLRPSPMLLTLLRLADTLDAGGGAGTGTVLDAVEKVLAGECRPTSLSTAACKSPDVDVRTEDEVDRLFCCVAAVLLCC